MNLLAYRFNATATNEVRPDLGDIDEFIKNKFDNGFSFGYDNLLQGYYRVAGWHFDFKPFLKCYLYHTDGLNWRMAYAPSIGALRRRLHLSRSHQVIKFPGHKSHKVTV